MRYLSLLFLLALPVLSACGEGGSSSTPDGGAPRDATANEPECFMNPTSHREIIDACTNAVRETKDPVLPLLQADGTLPPLP